MHGFCEQAGGTRVYYASQLLESVAWNAWNSVRCLKDTPRMRDEGGYWLLIGIGDIEELFHDELDIALSSSSTVEVRSKLSLYHPLPPKENLREGSFERQSNHQQSFLNNRYHHHNIIHNHKFQDTHDHHLCHA
ncbi:MAG: hypothetical protein Q9172_006225 [Xanthocarpia lactea]